ncbi:uncharacterized protein LOC142973815 [Anticarsia gemmatalis]|uniref:uncharacterized protein LOC142973815 n=1 Tax=Anticarsia gemmatalis TaxID=129554 RepID=UPI003F75D470
MSRRFVKVYDKFQVLAEALLIMMLVSNFLAIFTQRNLSQRQATDLSLTTITSPYVFYSYYTFLYYKKQVRDLLYNWVVVLKEHYSDTKGQMQMIREMKVYFGMVVISAAIVVLERALHSFINWALYGAIFNPFVTAWPDVTEASSVGFAIRLTYYIVTWLYSLRGQGTYGLIIILLVIPTYQFRDVQNYFYSLENIFKEDDSQEEKERKYEEGFRRGIYMHVLSLWCLRQCQYVCRTIFCGQLFVTIASLLLVMPPLLVSEGLSAKLPYVPMLVVILTELAIIMCNSGNITYEALGVADAIYCSGWHNCYGMSSVRVRKLVVISMMQAQQRVVLTAFGVLELSYENFVTIVKTAYSLFSVFY